MQAQVLARPAPVRPIPPDPTPSLIGIAKSFARGQEIYGEGEAADLVYRVVSGAVREVRVLADGRRQIVDFHFPGELFGVQAGRVYRAGAEAVCETTVTVARRSSLSGQSAESLWGLALRDLERCQDHALTLGRRSATERVVSFLLELAERLDAGASVELPISRQDMADYLGLTIETVSRTITQLQADGLIEVRCCRQVLLKRPRALAELCE
jgi:CRP/FNR family nitrogen fixation transcriptional regulator